MKKLVCDRCGLELTDKYDIELALEGQGAWEAAVKDRGNEPRGVYPCKNYIRCGGEMLVVEVRRGFWRRRQLVT
ncbi:hypothetical protein ACFLXO_05195 [Chloroflexota bacterium]